MKIFNNHNDMLNSTMKRHLIDVERDGICENDYDKFYDRRLKRITKELNKFIIPQEKEPLATLESYEDIEEEESDILE